MGLNLSDIDLATVGQRIDTRPPPRRKVNKQLIKFYVCYMYEIVDLSNIVSKLVEELT